MDPRRVIHKVVDDGRGALCYELAPLFCELLVQLGFLDVRLLSGRCFAKDRFGPEFDHALVLVGGRHLLDVGFGRVFLEPLDIQSLSPQVQLDGVPYKGTPLEDVNGKVPTVSHGRLEVWSAGEARTRTVGNPSL